MNNNKTLNKPPSSDENIASEFNESFRAVRYFPDKDVDIATGDPEYLQRVEEAGFYVQQCGDVAISPDSVWTGINNPNLTFTTSSRIGDQLGLQVGNNTDIVLPGCFAEATFHRNAGVVVPPGTAIRGGKDVVLMEKSFYDHGRISGFVYDFEKASIGKEAFRECGIRNKNFILRECTFVYENSIDPFRNDQLLKSKYNGGQFWKANFYPGYALVGGNTMNDDEKASFYIYDMFSDVPNSFAWDSIGLKDVYFISPRPQTVSANWFIGYQAFLNADINGEIQIGDKLLEIKWNAFENNRISSILYPTGTGVYDNYKRKGVFGDCTKFRTQCFYNAFNPNSDSLHLGTIGSLIDNIHVSKENYEKMEIGPYAFAENYLTKQEGLSIYCSRGLDIGYSAFENFNATRDFNIDGFIRNPLQLDCPYEWSDEIVQQDPLTDPEAIPRYFGDKLIIGEKAFANCHFTHFEINMARQYKDILYGNPITSIDYVDIYPLAFENCTFKPLITNTQGDCQIWKGNIGVEAFKNVTWWGNEIDMISDCSMVSRTFYTEKDGPGTNTEPLTDDILLGWTATIDGVAPLPGRSVGVYSVLEGEEMKNQYYPDGPPSQLSYGYHNYNVQGNFIMYDETQIDTVCQQLNDDYVDIGIGQQVIKFYPDCPVGGLVVSSNAFKDLSSGSYDTLLSEEEDPYPDIIPDPIPIYMAELTDGSQLYMYEYIGIRQSDTSPESETWWDAYTCNIQYEGDPEVWETIGYGQYVGGWIMFLYTSYYEGIFVLGHGEGEGVANGPSNPVGVYENTDSDIEILEKIPNATVTLGNASRIFPNIAASVMPNVSDNALMPLLKYDSDSNTIENTYDFRRRHNIYFPMNDKNFSS